MNTSNPLKQPESTSTGNVLKPVGRLRLNLGCGKDLRAGYINVDDGSTWNDNLPPNVVIWDLNKFPWPFDDNSADEILMWHVLEHLWDTTRVMREVKRILAPGGKFWGQVPYGGSRDGWACWQHYRYFDKSSFPSIAECLGFQLVYSRHGTTSVNWMHRTRNLIPMPLLELLAKAGFGEAFNVVDFAMIKPPIR